ncbi:MAG: stage III sporulation protein AA [Dethiobacteria bacterium]|mgnify:CR=1 FL=1
MNQWKVNKAMDKSVDILKKEIGLFLAPKVRAIIENIPPEVFEKTEEIRLRVRRPLAIYWKGGESFLNEKGLTSIIKDSYLISRDDLERTLELISSHSLYAYEEELRQGYLTIPGGHRVGLAGRAVLEGGKVRVLRDISSLNFRIARQVKGAGEKVLPFLIERHLGRIRQSLIISPPQGGKTTLLRDLARLISNGVSILNHCGQKVGIVDERSEIAACFRGVPQLDVGLRTDVLDACPKAQGIMMMLRSLSPQVIITDEIGREEDVKAIEEAVHAGVSIIASVHGSNLDEIFQRPILGSLLEKNYFERLVFLSNNRGPGTLEMIAEGERGVPLYSSRGGGELIECM